MNKIFKPFILLFKGIYTVIDKIIVTPISKIIYRVNGYFKDNSSKVERILNRPNVLIYVSLLLAIGIFVLIDSQVISLTENEAEVLTDQPVSVLYNQEAYVLEGVPEKVDITLIGSKSSIYLATQLGSHDVVLDLSDYSPGTYKVKLKYKHSVQSVDYKLDPSTVTVKISQKDRMVANLSYDIVNENKLDSKLSITKVALDTNEIIVKSSKEILDRVAVVKALIDASQVTLKESGEYKIDEVTLVAYDQNGERIGNIEMVPSKVSATVTIDSYHAVKPVRVIAKGDLKEGTAISNITSSVKEVTVYGEKSVVDALNYVEANVDVTNLDSNKTTSVNITKPSKIRYMTESTTNVTITVDNADSREVSGVIVRAINYDNTVYRVNAKTDEDSAITVLLKGVNAVISKMDTTNIVATIDLAGLGEGDNEVKVLVTVDDERVQAVPLKQSVTVKLTRIKR